MIDKLVTPLRWRAVAGGTCRYGDTQRPRLVTDLLVTITPLTRGQLGWPTSAPDLPVTGVDFAGATDLAAQHGGRLPTSTEWEWIAAGAQQRRYPWGDEPWTPARANLTSSDTSPTGPVPVRSHPDGATPDGVHDLAGNVWEWTATPVMGQGHVIRGGSYASRPLYARCTFLNAAPDDLRSPGIGIRLVKTP
ncbi:SUMF1/EgtB/PvdO family nonheme iron enzyme [Solwaraspora sp. WMMD1047]|uniref:formylglycine-generating enzyme family protein n=1 Tax=Solwaraspora sp. WMMD1047 TaxID=3016102 RepID=UPI00241786DE|nr:SUMF1/EgtB/PvdO family nonheme iron enzyme [Solwaraspora sp. WMMD1047]MDG4830008.1 SUMF1/EgtB/PvdO family nonheme iron enzyme [Solwaraspora sp. WMMD1047]